MILSSSYSQAATRVRTQPRRSGPVSSEVSAGVISGLMRYGLTRSRLVTDTSQLYPREEAIRRLEKAGWKTTEVDEGSFTMSLTAPDAPDRTFPIGQSVTFYAPEAAGYERDRDSYLRSSGDGIEEQTIVADNSGKATYNFWRMA